jgi:hypothetical protein
MKARNLLRLAALSAALLSSSAFAVPYIITSTLTGDIRARNPDNLIVNVTITGDTTSNEAQWVVDINSPSHPNIRLHDFYFNLTGDPENYLFSGFNPSGWDIITSPASVHSARGATFMFETLDPAGPPNAADVTNIQTLSFVMTYTLGNLSISNFLNAPVSVSNNAGSGQLGAHLQSLSTDGCTGCSDRGFAFGNYVNVPIGGDQPVPEPGILSLLVAGLLGIGLTRAKRKLGIPTTKSCLVLLKEGRRRIEPFFGF